MKKIIVCFIAIIMVLSLCACDFAKDLIDSSLNITARAKTFQCGSLSIELNSEFLTMNFIDDSYDFIWGTDEITVMGIFSEFDKETLDNMTALDYATIFRDQIAHVDPTEIADLDGIPTMQYTTTEDDDETTVLIACYEATDGIWVVMFGVDADDYTEYYASICEYAKTVKCS